MGASRGIQIHGLAREASVLTSRVMVLAFLCQRSAILAMLKCAVPSAVFFRWDFTRLTFFYFSTRIKSFAAFQKAHPALRPIAS